MGTAYDFLEEITKREMKTKEKRQRKRRLRRRGSKEEEN